MTIDELLIEISRDTAARDARTRFAAELRDQRASSSPEGVTWMRRTMAGALVRAGVWLDRRAGERVLKPAAR